MTANAENAVKEKERGIRLLTENDCNRLIAEGKTYLVNRWRSYYEYTVSFLRDLPVGVFDKPVLEVGPAWVPFVEPSVKMDIRDYGVGAILYDGGNIKWPFEAGQFGLVILSQSLEHLASTMEGRGRSLAEACRVADNCLLTLPWEWNGPADHAGIDQQQLTCWMESIRGEITCSVDIPAVHGQARRLVYIQGSRATE